MKKRFKIEGYSFNLKKEVSRIYYEDEIFIHEGEAAALNGACICVANRFRDNPRFKEGEYTLNEITE